MTYWIYILLMNTCQHWRHCGPDLLEDLMNEIISLTIQVLVSAVEHLTIALKGRNVCICSSWTKQCLLSCNGVPQPEQHNCLAFYPWLCLSLACFIIIGQRWGKITASLSLPARNGKKSRNLLTRLQSSSTDHNDFHIFFCTKLFFLCKTVQFMQMEKSHLFVWLLLYLSMQMQVDK